MEKIRDLFKKTKDSKGTFHAKMDTIKERSSKDLTEAEEIKIEWQEYIEEWYEKGLNDMDNHNSVEWALRRITMNKASGGDRIPTELFQILKDNAFKVLHSVCQQIWKT